MLKVSCLGVFFPCALFLLSGQARSEESSAIEKFDTNLCNFVVQVFELRVYQLLLSLNLGG